MDDNRLDSWKEIAAYLKRDVSTVQRWEKREGMPVHRHVHDKLGSVGRPHAGVELVFTPDSLDAIAAQAIKRGTGARGLRAILEEVLLNTMYDLPSRTDVERVVIDRDVVAEKVNPTLVPARVEDGPTEKSA